MAQYRVTYRRDPRGHWVGWVRGHRSCRVTTRSIREARLQLRRALGTRVDDPDHMDFVEDVRLPGSARRQVVKHWAARRRASREQTRSREATREAVRALLDMKLKVKDAADILGLTYLQANRLLKRKP